MRRILLTLTALVCLAPLAGAQETVSREIELGRQFTEQFYRGELSAVYAHFSEGLREEMSMDSFRGIRRRLDDKLGVELETLDERVELRDDYRVYVRKARFAKNPQQILVTWWLRTDGTIGAFKFQPAQIAKQKAPTPASNNP